MSPPRRRSARLATAPTPKGKTSASPQLPSLAERDEPLDSQTELPSFANNINNNSASANRRNGRGRADHHTGYGAMPSTPPSVPSTPISSPIKPAFGEMHPTRAPRPSMNMPPSGQFGFHNIRPAGENAPANRTPSRIGGTFTSLPIERNAIPPWRPMVPGTPNESAASGADDALPPPDGSPIQPSKVPIKFPFQVELSATAQAMIEQMREQAEEIKAQLVAQRETEARQRAESGCEGPFDRKIATAKGRSSRFSAAHMAEFKKMDSIEGHASAWRANKSALSDNTGGSPMSSRTGLKRSPSKANLDEIPNTRVKASLKRTSSVADLDSQKEADTHKKPYSANKPSVAAKASQSVPSKRFKQRQEDDTSNARPISRDGSSIPRPTSSSGDAKGPLPKSFLDRLANPTKSFLAHTAQQGKPTVSLVPPSPSKGSGLSKSASAYSLKLDPAKVAEFVQSPDFKRRNISPGRFQKVKSILRGDRTKDNDPKTALPGPTLGLSKTPNPRRVDHTDKALPPVPLTTPRRKLTKHVAWTPDLSYSPAPTPTPKRSILKLMSRRPLEEVTYPTLDDVPAKNKPDDVTYPDLSAMLNNAKKGSAASNSNGKTNGDAGQNVIQTKPGTFSFRSDHTIEFGPIATTGFGGSSGQSSIRQVRGSILPAKRMPGSFPAPPPTSSHPNKENQPSPSEGFKMSGVAHGIRNKKRLRPSTDEEDAVREEEERATKRRKQEEMLDAVDLFCPNPRLRETGLAKKAREGGTPSRSNTPNSARTPNRNPILHRANTSAKKRPMLSLSRLNMLARPKSRG